MSQVVYVEPTEELASVVQKLESAEEMDLVLLVPKGVALLKDLLQWNLLQRQVRALGKSVVVVTHDRGARFGARQAGFPVYRSLRRMKIKPGQSQPVPLRRYLKKGRGSSIPVVLVSVSLGALLFLALGAYLVLPTGAVSLKPVAQEIALTISVKASQQVRDVDAVASQIPARLLQTPIEGIETMDSTGRKTVPGSARGEVTFLNRSPARLVIPASTLLAAGQSVQFKTLDQAEVPPSGGTARTRVIASSPGTTGNVGSMAIDHVVDESYASALAVWNEIPTSGGVEEETMTVTAQDQSNLRSRLRGKLVKDGQAQLQALKSESESIYPITVSFSPMEETFDKAIGAEASSLTLRIKGSVSGLAFDGKDVNTLAQKALEAQVAPGFRLLPTTLAVAPLEAYDWGEGWVAFRALAKAKASVMIEGDKLAESLRGKNPKEAQEYLNGRFPQHEQLTIQVKPIWLDWIPVYFWKIEVRY